MKTSPLVLAVTLLVPAALRAQLVADGTTATLANVTTNITGDVIVGTNGPFTLLVFSNNALLTNSANGVIGLNAAARSNEVHLVSPTARWLMNGTLRVGSNGAFSTLIVSNGALVHANAGVIGTRATSGSNVVLVTGAGSMWSNVAGLTGVGLTVGSLGSGNQLIVSNGGWVVNANASGSIGSNSSNNVARVTGPGSVWSNRFGLNINPIGAGNVNNGLVIEDGGQVFDDDGLINGLNGSSNNFALITGSGSVWNNSRDLYLGSSVRALLVVSNGGTVLSANSYVGSGGSQVLVTGSGSWWRHQNDLVLAAQNNTLVVTNGGGVVNSNGYMGGLTGGAVSASNNLVVVTGAGSTWSNRADLFVGFAGSRNQLVVSNGGTVTASNVFIGFQSQSLDNRLTVDGGTLRVTNAAGAGVLDVRRGTTALNTGLIVVDALRMTNSAGLFAFSRGTLAAERSTVNNGQAFFVGNSVGAATFNLTGNGAHSFANGLTIFANAALTGNGTIGGFLILSGILRPGEAIGKIAFSIPPSLAAASRTFMEVSRNGSDLTNDVVQVAGTLTYGGSLTVTNIGPDAPAPGNNFKLFAATGFAGAFIEIILPTLPVGLLWTNKLLVDGSIEVLGVPPTVQTLGASVLGVTNATLNGLANPKGSSTLAWFEWGTSTNYGNVTAAQALGSGTTNTSFSEILTGLVAGVTYHFRAVGSNAIGLVFGNDLTFPNLTLQAYLKASNTGSNDVFGFVVALSDNTLVVGGRFESSDATGVNGDQSNDNAVGSGAAYVFVRNGTNWVQQAYLKASNTESNDQFGTSVGISGDTIVVGARFESSSSTGVNGNGADNTAPNAGAAYVFVRSGTTWTQQAYLKASNTGAGDTFGQRAAISGDTIVIGAQLESSSATGINGDGNDNSATNAGAAYVFVRNGTNWTQQAYVKASNTGAGDAFGSWVAVESDTLVIGATLEDSSALGVNGNQSNNTATNSGAAYVFVRNGTNWTQQAYLKASNTDSNDEFGLPVGISDDTIVVAARLEASNAKGVNGDQTNNLAPVTGGAAYVFVRNDTNWVQQAYLKASNTDNDPAGSFEQFGFAMAVSGDTVVVGAVGEDSDATGVNGDQSNNNAGGSGAAYVFVRSGTNWTQQAYVKASNTGTSDLFGNSLALSDEMLVVAARQEDSNATGVNGDGSDNSATDSGAAYVFDFPITPVPLLSIASNGASQVTLSWTPPTPGFVLQESVSLPPLSWSNSPSGETNPITLPAAEQTKFFRLFKP